MWRGPAHLGVLRKGRWPSPSPQEWRAPSCLVPVPGSGGPIPGAASGCPLHSPRAVLSLSLPLAPLWPPVAQQWHLMLVHASSQLLALVVWVGLVVLLASGSPQVGVAPRPEHSRARGVPVPARVGRSQHAGAQGVSAACRCSGTRRGAAWGWCSRETPQNTR